MKNCSPNLQLWLYMVHSPISPQAEFSGELREGFAAGGASSSHEQSRAARKCVRTTLALSHSVTGKECLEPGILQAARMRKLPKCFKIKQQTKEMQMNPTESRKQCNIFRYPFVLSGISRAFHQLCPTLQITVRGKCAIYKVSNRNNPKSHRDNYGLISLQHAI